MNKEKNKTLKEYEIEEILRSHIGSIISQYGIGLLKHVLIIPPDYTRYYSGAGLISGIYYHLITAAGGEADVMPALGTHVPMTEAEIADMYKGIPLDRFIVHNWKNDVVRIGTVPASFVSEVSEGIVEQDIAVEVNRRIVSNEYTYILSIGQVVPHEVVGMSNRNKNIFVGCGGESMINSSHMLGAFYGMERMMGRADTPVRRVFDYAEDKFLSNVPLEYVMTVTSGKDIHGVFIGRDRSVFREAAALSQKINMVHVDKPFKKAVVYLDPKEFKSTWLGNKAIYRTRMAMADGGELVILAPGVERFGEDDTVDSLIRKYGYCGRENVLELVKHNDDLLKHMSAAAHLIHGSSDGRFNITYCAGKLSREEITGACFNYLPYDEAAASYDISRFKDGYNMHNGEKIYYISNPALGLWIYDSNN